MTSFRRPLSFIPNFLPDQTLYSWVSDYHFHSGNASPEISVEQLFWTTRAGWCFHLPSHLDNFCASTRRIFGAPEDLIAERTILPAYLWFRPEQVQTDIVNRLRGETTAGIPQQLGLWKTSTSSAASRRLCTKCCEEDTRKHGEPYWHRSPQLPGVMVCLEHQQPLLISKTSVRSRYRYHFATPNDDLSKNQCESIHIASSSTLDALLKIAAIAIQLAQLHTEMSPWYALSLAVARMKVLILGSLFSRLCCRFRCIFVRCSSRCLGLDAGLLHHVGMRFRFGFGSLIAVCGDRAQWQRGNGSKQAGQQDGLNFHGISPKRFEGTKHCLCTSDIIIILGHCSCHTTDTRITFR